jgi:hypothetical protein
MAGGVDIARVIHQHVDWAEFSFHSIEHGVYLSLDSNIGGDRDRTIEGARDFGGASLVEVIDRDAGALSGEPFGYGAPDAVARAGDKHDGAGESLHIWITPG